MSNHDQDPFAKYDKLFEEQDRTNIVKSATKEKKTSSTSDQHEPKKPHTMSDADKKKAIRIILTVFFVVLLIQTVPVIMFSQGMGTYRFAPFFSIVVMFIIINILIKVFKR